MTPHSVRRYRDRVPGKCRLTYEQALAELIAESERAHFVRDNGDGTEQWRGAKPHRLRFRVARGNTGKPQLVTVLRGCDAGWQR